MQVHGVRYWTLVIGTAALLIWLTLWDVILYVAGLLPGYPLSGFTVPMYFGLLGGTLAFWAMIQHARWCLHFVARFDTYSGFTLSFLGSLPLRVFPSALGRTDEVASSVVLWLLIGAVLVGKVTIWVFWYRMIALQGIMSLRGIEGRRSEM